MEIKISSLLSLPRHYLISTPQLRPVTDRGAQRDTEISEGVLIPSPRTSNSSESCPIYTFNFLAISHPYRAPCISHQLTQASPRGVAKSVSAGQYSKKRQKEKRDKKNDLACTGRFHGL